MTSGAGGPATVEYPADLELLREVLRDRGWREDDDVEWCWRWPVPQPDGMLLFRTGPLIMFDEEDPGLGFLVESPLLWDASAPMLRYRSVQLLIMALDRVETWRYPQQAAEIDADQVVGPGGWSVASSPTR